MIAVEPNQFWILGKVFDRFVMGLIVLGAKNPTEMAPVKAAVRIMWVTICIGKAMVPAMVACPPERTLLS